MANGIEEFHKRLKTLDASQWGARTPCAEWDVRTLVNHVTGELLWIPPLLEGKTVPEVGDRFDGDVLGDDPQATWLGAVAGAEAAAAAPGALDGIAHLSFGDFPASDYLGQVTSDAIIHAWDLARALGVDDRWDPAISEFVVAFMDPQIEAWRSAGAFGPAVDVPPGADTQDRLLAQTGRSPSWRP